MKDIYPRSNPWPYIAPGVLLFAFVLTPQPEGAVKKLRGLYDDALQLLQAEETRPALQRDRVIVAFDPVDYPVAAEPPLEGGIVDRRTDDGDFNAHGEARTRRLQSSPPLSHDTPYVWQPPPGWVPRPIRPLSTSDRDLEANNQPTRVQIKAPVGRRIVRSPRMHGPRSQDERRDNPESYGSRSIETNKQGTESGKQESSNGVVAEDTETIRIRPRSEGLSDGDRLANSDNPSGNLWPSCPQLHDQLTQAIRDEVLLDWANAIRTELRRLESGAVVGSDDQLRSVSLMRRLATARISTKSWPHARRQLYDRIRFAAIRRVDVWEPLLQLARSESGNRHGGASLRLGHSASELLAQISGIPNADRWSDYLGLTDLQKDAQSVVQAAEVAEKILRRMHSDALTSAQRDFLASSPFHDFEAELREVIAASISPGRAIHTLERYESEQDQAAGNDVVSLLRRWQLETDDNPYRPTINAITQHYRNANLRVAVTEDLINRFVPAIHQYAEAVNDTILGAQVRGSNSTLANLSVRLSPDPTNVRLGLLANGSVHSNTASRKGPVTLFNRGQSNFSAGKEFVVSSGGIFVSQTETRVSTGNRMVGLRTELDDIPLLGWIIRSIARQQHDEQRPFLRAEIVRRVRRSATQRMDREVQKRLATVEANINNRVLSPLRRMALDPKPLEMRTTADRAIMRVRLASPMQFGAHTPRPQARADSVMSVQIHQTAANNLIEQLDLQGRRLTLEELASRVSEQLGIALQIPNEQHRDTYIQFADLHPLEFQFDGGQITLTMHLAKLDNGRRKWENFSVRGYYRADVQRLDVELIRDEGIELISEKLGLRDQLALRGIFTKVFAKNTRLEVLHNAIQRQPNLRNLSVTQLEIRDGWLALALGEDTMMLVDRPTRRR